MAVLFVPHAMLFAHLLLKSHELWFAQDESVVGFQAFSGEGQALRVRKKK